MKSTTFLLRTQSEWAFIVVTEISGLTLMIHSSFGNWCFTWSHPGEDAVKFIETADVHYTFKKFSNAMRMSLPPKYEKREFDSYSEFYKKFWPLLVKELKLES